MICQLKSLQEAVIDFSLFQKIFRCLFKIIHLILHSSSKNLCARIDQSNFLSVRVHDATDYKISQISKFQLNFHAGDKVRVKSWDDILKTLDNNNKFQGLACTPTMKRYCGETHRVLKRLEKVFDERRWKLSRIRNVVLLENVYCDGAGGIEKDWDGCDRTCYLWWKEGWLEKICE